MVSLGQSIVKLLVLPGAGHLSRSLALPKVTAGHKKLQFVMVIVGISHLADVALPHTGSMSPLRKTKVSLPVKTSVLS